MSDICPCCGQTIGKPGDITLSLTMKGCVVPVRVSGSSQCVYYQFKHADIEVVEEIVQMIVEALHNVDLPVTTQKISLVKDEYYAYIESDRLVSFRQTC